jgi:predicted nucleic acid-binding protein
MIVVDSSVWIDWFRGSHTSQTAKLRAIPPRDIVVGDIVLLEVLRGARDDRLAQRVEADLSKFNVATMLDADLAAFAASNYRRLRSLGVTVRKTSDLIIGTFCIANNHHLLHADRDFLLMQEHLGLRCL